MAIDKKSNIVLKGLWQKTKRQFPNKTTNEHYQSCPYGTDMDYDTAGCHDTIHIVFNPLSVSTGRLLKFGINLKLMRPER